MEGPRAFVTAPKQHFSKARETNDYQTERPNLMIENFTAFT
jgi:hypothetical protein